MIEVVLDGAFSLRVAREEPGTERAAVADIEDDAAQCVKDALWFLDGADDIEVHVSGSVVPSAEEQHPHRPK
jgi:uncharacterized protein YneR